jgi:Deltex C-terminal domain
MEDSVEVGARAFVTMLDSALDEFQSSSEGPLPVLRIPVDEMMVAARKLLCAQHEFRTAGDPTEIDIGYHYTRMENIASIRAHGLMTWEERAKNKIQAVEDNGTRYGQGVYTAANPYAYHGYYGDVGLIVARLPGRKTKFSKKWKCTRGSVVVHSGDDLEILKLKRSVQCLPIMMFDASIINSNGPMCSGNATVDRYHLWLQQAIDKHCNTQTAFPLHLRELAWNSETADLSEEVESIDYVAPQNMGLRSLCGFWSCVSASVPEDLVEKACNLCHGPFEVQPGERLEVVRHFSCEQIYHLHCADEHEIACVLCEEPLSHLHGRMPSGTMNVRISCSMMFGRPTTRAIVIEYMVDSGIQKRYHVHPHKKHSRATRVAYLPYNTEGRDLLKRLKYAFRCGLTFDVGVSLTNGKDSRVIWSTISHKTSYDGGGPNSFPDPSYIATCNRQLDALKVPKASCL